MQASTVFYVIGSISMLLFLLVLFQRTFIAQLLGPGLADPRRYHLGEYTGDIDLWLRPY